MGKLTIKEIEALFTDEVIERLANRVMETVGINSQKYIETKKHDKEIVQYVVEGYTTSAVAKIFGLTGAGVCGIFHRYIKTYFPDIYQKAGHYGRDPRIIDLRIYFPEILLRLERNNKSLTARDVAAKSAKSKKGAYMR